MPSLSLQNEFRVFLLLFLYWNPLPNRNFLLSSYHISHFYLLFNIFHRKKSILRPKCKKKIKVNKIFYGPGAKSDAWRDQFHIY